jgi:prepilin-type N-terminal cleavage/methylation domain-containing protein
MRIMRESARVVGRGFTLIEMLVVVAIVAVLAAAGAPSLSLYLQNTQILGVAQSTLAGVQIARGQAITQNGNVSIVFSGKSWCVYDRTQSSATLCDSTVATGGGVLRVQMDRSPATISSVSSPGSTTQVTFGGLGRPVANLDLTATMTDLNITSTMANTKQYKIQMSDGAVRLCEMNHYPNGDPRACL